MKSVREAGFTLIELLLVISIIALLIAMTLPTLANARKAAHATQCSSNMRQFMTALNIYATDNDTLPYTNSQGGESDPNAEKYWAGAGWLYDGPINDGTGRGYDVDRREQGAIWEYLGTGDVYHCSLDDAPTLELNQVEVGTRYMSSYVMNRAMNGWNQTLPRRPAWAIDAFDNPSASVAMWEGDETQTPPPDSGSVSGHWNDGNNDPDTQGPSLRHNEAGTVGFLDGHIEAWSWLRYFDVAIRVDDQPNELFCNPGTSWGGSPEIPPPGI